MGESTKHARRLTEARHGGQSSRLFDQDQVTGGVVEDIAGLSTANDDVLDAHPELTRQIDAWLYRERIARGELFCVPLDDVGVFVHLESNAVTCSMDEPLAVTRLLDHSPGRSIDFLTRDAGAARIPGRDVCLMAQGVAFPGLFRKLT